MGWNSLIFICNDAVGEIEKDPAGWWAKAWSALSNLAWDNPRAGVFGHGNRANGFQAVSNAHADTCVVVIAGGNYATLVDSSHRGNFGHHDIDDQIDILEDALRRLKKKRRTE